MVSVVATVESIVYDASLSPVANLVMTRAELAIRSASAFSIRNLKQCCVRPRSVGLPRKCRWPKNYHFMQI